MSVIKGTYQKKIFQALDTGYLIALFKVTEASDDVSFFLHSTITIVGYCPVLNEMDTYLLHGHVVEHPKYGKQFEFEQLERILPSEENAMVDILSSDMFKGIGKKTAQRLVDTFQEKTFDVILHQEQDLLMVPSITKKQVQTLHESLLSYQASYEIILQLSTLGFSPKEAMRFYHHYKDKLLDILQQDIYQIYYDLEDVSFKKIDTIALKSQYQPDCLERLRALVIYAMIEISNVYGHTYYLEEELLVNVRRLASFFTIDELACCLESLEQMGLIVIREEKLYLKEYFEAEVLIARRFRLLAHEDRRSFLMLAKMIKELENSKQIVYNEEQKEAITLALSSSISIITGGPGTGKTTIIGGIISLYQQLHHYSTEDLMKHLALLAPTGRASKRMGEVSSLSASTIHRFLKWNKDTNRFQINEYHKSEVSLVIVDEASMVDTKLLASLLKGLSSNCHLVFVGDANQLPSVGAGNALEDMIQSGEIPMIALKNIYRQEKGSAIISFAHALQDGIFLENAISKDGDLEFIETTEKTLISTIETIAKEVPSFQVLAPMYKSIVGIDKINTSLQQLLNPKSNHKKEYASGDIIFREGDKVIQLVNMPDDNVYNGDIGIIRKIKLLGKKEIYVSFDGNEVCYTPSMLSTLRHAFAISIHKSQGSEFPVVIIPLSLIYQKMLYRKLIYTAITRAKGKLILVGDKKALQLAIARNITNSRRTTLQEFLKNGIV